MIEHSVDRLPIGSYPDPLRPILVHCDDVKSLFMIVRKGQNQHIGVFPGFETTITSLALNIHQDEDADNIKLVKIWLDPDDTISKGILLATLRPDSYEQHTLSLPLLCCHEDATKYRVRMEVIPKIASKEVPMEGCEIHIIGKVEPTPYSNSPDDEDDECSTGQCEQ